MEQTVNLEQAYYRTFLMSPPDFDLFPKLKEPLKAPKPLEKEVADQVRLINFGCLATGVTDQSCG